MSASPLRYGAVGPQDNNTKKDHNGAITVGSVQVASALIANDDTQNQLKIAPKRTSSYTIRQKILLETTTRSKEKIIAELKEDLKEVNNEIHSL